MDFQTNYANYYIKPRFPHVPPVEKIVHDIDLVLVNTNNFVDYPKLVPPNVKFIAGIHLPSQVQPLPRVTF